MQYTSVKYKQIIAAGDYITDCRVLIMDSNGTEQTVNQSELVSVEISEGCFETVTVGMAVSAEIELSMLVPSWSPARMARIRPQIRVRNSTATSEWLNKGVFWLDTRRQTKAFAGDDVLTIHGYDGMLMAEQEFWGVNWTERKDYLVLQDICNNIPSWSLNSETNIYIQTLSTNLIPTPYGMTVREVLQSIAAERCGNFVMDENGELKLIPLTSAPAETYYLITRQGNPITIGGDRIVLL